MVEHVLDLLIAESAARGNHSLGKARAIGVFRVHDDFASGAANPEPGSKCQFRLVGTQGTQSIAQPLGKHRVHAMAQVD